MKKRFMSLLLVLVMVLSLLPTFAAAEDQPGKQNEMGYVKLPTPEGGWTADAIEAWKTTQNIPEGYDAADESKAGVLYYYNASTDEYFPVKVGKNDVYTQVGFKGSVYTEFKPENFPTPDTSSDRKVSGVSSKFYVKDSAGNYCNLMYNYEHHTTLNYHEYIPYYVSPVEGSVALYHKDGGSGEAEIAALYKAHTSKGSYDPVNGVNYNDHWGGRQYKWDGWYKIESGSTYKEGDHNQFDYDLWTKSVPQNRNYIAYTFAGSDVYINQAGNETIDNLAVYTGDLYYLAVKEENDPPQDPPAYVDATKPNAKGGLYSEVDKNGMHLSKELIPQPDGSYTIEMKAYATGKTVQEGNNKPTDIILVLDQSGSMEWDISYKDGYTSLSSVKYDKLDSNPNDYYVKVGDEYYQLYYHREETPRESGDWGFGTVYNYWWWYGDPDRTSPNATVLVDCWYRYNELKTSEANIYASHIDGIYQVKYSTTSRLTALKSAVNEFLGAIAEKEGDFRIGIVGFTNQNYGSSQGGDNSEIFSGYNSTSIKTLDPDENYYTYAMREAGSNDLVNSVSTLTDQGGTKPDDGFMLVQRILDDREKLEDSKDRNVVIVFFTDGQPDDVDYGEDAINIAHTLKDTGDEGYGATIYSIGVFSDGDGEHIDEYDDESPTIGEFMTYVSSDYPDAESFENHGDPNPSGTGYYQMVAGSKSLADIFDDVSEDVGGSSVTLNGLSELRDGIDLANFTRPAVGDIEVFTQKGNFTADGQAPDFTGNAEVPQTGYFRTVTSDGVVMVRDFDYATNFIGANKPANTDPEVDLAANQGRQIIVRIKGLEPTHTGNQLGSNDFGVGEDSWMRAGVFRNHAAVNPVIQADVPWINVGERTVVMDFGATAVLAQAAAGANAKTNLAGATSNKFVNDDAKVTFSYNKNLANAEVFPVDLSFSGVESAMVYGKQVTGTNAQGQLTFASNDPIWQQVNVIPANSIYFDDTMESTEAGFDANGVGYNAALTGDTEANAAAGDADGRGTLTFTFTGDGIDVYCTTPDANGWIQATVDGTNKQPYTNTKYHDGTGKELHNIPVISFRNLGTGTHTLVITTLTQSNFKLDGIRVYNTTQDATGDDATTVNNAYAAANEQNAVFMQVRQYLLSKAQFESVSENGVNSESTVAGAVFIDTNNAATSVADYTAAGPKNEVYLAPNQGVAFQIRDWDSSKYHAMVGLSVPAGGSASVAASGRTGTDGKISVNSETTMFYNITPDENGNVYIFNTTGSSMVSVTDLKITGTQKYVAPLTFTLGAPIAPESEGGALMVQPMMLMRYVEDFDPEAMIVDPTEDPGTPDDPGEPQDPGTPSDPDTPDQPDDPKPGWNDDAYNPINILRTFFKLLLDNLGSLFGGLGNW